MPGLKIFSPMTPGEYESVYKQFMAEDEVYYVSEHRGAYGNTEEMPNIYKDNAKITLFPISITRFAAVEAAKELEKEGIQVDVCHIMEIKPFRPSVEELASLRRTGKGIVLDDDYVDGIAKSLAFDLNKLTGADIDVMGLDNKTAGFYSQVDNLPPSKEKIIQRIRELL
jgi:pyruvate/2-oxoglutarate/acetoin dehydrogenase E1 component